MPVQAWAARLVGSFAEWLFRIPPAVPEADRRVYVIRLILVMVAGSMHVGLALIFASFERWWLLAVNLGSIAWYLTVIGILRTGRQHTAMFLGFTEALLHGFIFTIVLGLPAGYVFYNFAFLTVAFLTYRATEARARFTLVGVAVLLTLAEILVMRQRAPLLALGDWEIEVLCYLNVIGSLLAGIGGIYYFDTATDRAETRLARALARSDSLLLNILPEPVADRLKHQPGTIADHFPSVTVLFADIVGFTPLAAKLSSAEVVEMLNEVFCLFDRAAERFRVEKIKTIGDAYMVVGGLPEPRADHADAVCDMALEMQAAVRDYSARAGLAISLRIGIHSGPVVAGVIGYKKFAYDIWGDTVNTASRMESHGVPGRIQVTDATRRLLTSRYALEERGAITLKGKGEVVAWFLSGSAEDPRPRGGDAPEPAGAAAVTCPPCELREGAGVCDTGVRAGW